MSRRKKKHLKKSHSKKSAYLFPEYEEINAAAERDTMINLPYGVKHGKAGQGTSSVTVYPQHQAYKPCDHPGDKVVFEYGDKKLYASNTHCLKEGSGKWDLIIDLANVVWQPRVTDYFVKDGNPKRFIDKLRKFCGVPVTNIKSELLKLDWNDMQPPPVSLDFWIHLWDLMPEKTVIACYGGHGRTGTCLAALMIASGLDYYSAVETVRTDHCHKAIETTGQEKYLHSLYVEMLRRAIKSATAQGNTGDIVDFEADLTYALSHVPNAHDSMGGEIEYKTKKVETATDVVLNKDDKSEDSEFTDENGNQMKLMKGGIYTRECVNTMCTVPGCKVETHQGWVKWDDVDMSDDGFGYGAGH